MPAAKPPEFRLRAVELVRRGEQTLPQIARDQIGGPADARCSAVQPGMSGVTEKWARRSAVHRLRSASRAGPLRVPPT
jgi:hypothetical protein